MNVDSLLALILFVIPGFIGFEVANFLSPRRAVRYTERERLSAIIIMGCAVFQLSAWWRHKTFGCAWLDLQKPSHLDNRSLGILLLSSLIVGLLWSVVREVLPLIRTFLTWAKNKLGLRAYQGARPIWNLFCERFSRKYSVEVLTENNLVYHGCIDTHPSLDDDSDLILDFVSVAHLEEGQAVPPESSFTDLGDDEVVYLRGTGVRAVRLIPLHDDTPCKRWFDSVKSWFMSWKKKKVAITSELLSPELLEPCETEPDVFSDHLVWNPSGVSPV